MNMKSCTIFPILIASTMMLGACGSSAGSSSGDATERAALKWCTKFLQRSEFKLSKETGEETCSCMQDEFKYADVSLKDFRGSRREEVATIALGCMESSGGLDELAGYSDEDYSEPYDSDDSEW